MKKNNKNDEFELKKLKENKPFLIATLIATILFVALIANANPSLRYNYQNMHQEMFLEMQEHMTNENFEIMENEMLEHMNEIYDSNNSYDFHSKMHQAMHGEKTNNYLNNDLDINEKRETFMKLEGEIQEELLGKKIYKCCLENPCHTCISLSPWHGEGASCSCLEDLVDGVAPCGECVGGILAGRGNPYLAQYFAKSISDEIGQDYLDELKLIIEEKYGVLVDDQY